MSKFKSDIRELVEYCYIEDNTIKYCDHTDYEYMYDKYPEDLYVDIYYICNVCGHVDVVGASYDELDLEYEV